MATERINHHQDRIIQDPAILVGKPVVRGTRIPVELVLAKLAHNPDLDELFADYPRLTVEDVKACLEYARGLVEKKDQAARRRRSTKGQPVTEADPLFRSIGSGRSGIPGGASGQPKEMRG